MTMAVRLRFVNRLIRSVLEAIPKHSRICPKTALFLAEDLAVLPGEPLKDLLLLLDRQYGDPLFSP